MAAVYTLLNAFAFRADGVRAPHELFGVARVTGRVTERAVFAREAYDALLDETNAFVDAFASTGDVSALVAVWKASNASAGPPRSRFRGLSGDHPRIAGRDDPPIRALLGSRVSRRPRRTDRGLK